MSSFHYLDLDHVPTIRIHDVPLSSDGDGDNIYIPRSFPRSSAADITMTSTTSALDPRRLRTGAAESIPKMTTLD